MKKILSTIFTIIFCTIISTAQIKFGPKIGLNLSSAHISIPSPDSTTKVSSSANIKASYAVGGMAEARLGDAFAVQLSVLLSNKGYNFIEVYENKVNPPPVNSKTGYLTKSSVITNRGTRSLLYIDIPINFIYKKDLGIGKVMFGLGGYFSYNLWGVSKEKNTYVLSSSSDLGLTSLDGTYDLKKSNELKNTDYGASVMAGLEFNEKTQLSIGYNVGLADINPSNATVKNRVVSITVSYLFGNK